MTTYQLVPYLISVHVVRKKEETRPLDDLRAGQEDLVTELAGLLHVHRDGLRQEPGAAQKPARLQVESVQVGNRTLYAVVSPGRSGVESTIRKPSGETVDRNFLDHELINLRHLIHFPPNGHRAVLLAERVGGQGAITALSRLLKQAWNQRFAGETMLEIRPALSDAALEGALAKQPIKQLVLSRPTLPSGSLVVGGLRSTMSTVIKPPRGKRWVAETFLNRGGDIATGILSEVTPILRPEADPVEAAKAMLDEGWQVAVTLKLLGGTERTVNVGSTTAVSMSFPILEDDEEPDHRPTDQEFADAGRRVITDGLLDAFGIYPESADACTWCGAEWDDSGEWKVVWDVSQPSPNPSGSIL